VRCTYGIIVGIVTFGLTGCAVVAYSTAKHAIADTKNCIAENRDSPEGRVVYARIWKGEATAHKLTDPNPLTKAERDAYVVVHNRLVQCRQLIIDHDNRWAAWEVPYWQQYFARSDAIYLKLVSGEIPVGIANRLTIENMGKFQEAVAQGHAQAVAEDEARRQRAAEALAALN
jgi:hypothetical protein